MLSIRSVLKSWLFRSLIIGLFALGILYAYNQSASVVIVSNTHLASQLYHLNQSAWSTEVGNVDANINNMCILMACVLMFAAGMASTALSRCQGSVSPGWLPALIAGAVPTLVIDVYMLYSSISSVEYTEEMYLRPTEPICMPMVLLLIVVATVLCLLPALAGGWLVYRGYRYTEK